MSILSKCPELLTVRYPENFVWAQWNLLPPGLQALIVWALKENCLSAPVCDTRRSELFWNLFHERARMLNPLTLLSDLKISP